MELRDWSTECIILSPFAFLLFMVPRTRLELAHRNRHYPLKVACLPIPPPGRIRMKDKRQKAKDKSKSSYKKFLFSFFPFTILLLSFYFYLLSFPSAQNRTRTCTSLLTLVPETSASTNSAIWAYSLLINQGQRPVL